MNGTNFLLHNLYFLDNGLGSQQFISKIINFIKSIKVTNLWEKISLKLNFWHLEYSKRFKIETHPLYNGKRVVLYTCRHEWQLILKTPQLVSPNQEILPDECIKSVMSIHSFLLVFGNCQQAISQNWRVGRTKAFKLQMKGAMDYILHHIWQILFPVQIKFCPSTGRMDGWLAG